MKLLKSLILGVAALMLLNPASVFAGQKKVLMVLSGYGQQPIEGQQEEKPGYEFDEFAQAYLVFKLNNVAVDVASPQGGKVVADKYNKDKPFNQKVLADKAIMAKLDNTLSMQQVSSKDYDGIFVVGGKGAMFDFPKDKNLHKVIAEIYENKGTVAAVCHGPAALTEVKLSDGEYLVSGKRVNGFTNQEEKMFGKKWVKHFDFLLEDRLIERGGKYQKSEAMLSHVAIDGRLITGQNPASTPKIAEALVRSLGLEPATRTPFGEEATLDYIAEVWSGSNIAFNETDHDPKLVAMYGYYRLMYAESEAEIQKSVALMETSQQYFQHPVIELSLAEGYKSLGNKVKAKSLLNALLAQDPENQQAKDLLQTL